MAHLCRQVSGSAASCAGWVAIIVATATSDWVRTCDYSVATCVRMDELGSRGLWAECVISPALYHCVALSQVLSLPAYIQTSRALMICSCLLGLPSLLLVLMSMPCVRLQNDTAATRQRRALVGGVLCLLMALCGGVSTVWFPIAAHREQRLMAFGFSLYAGWVCSGLCLLGAAVVLFCRGVDPGPQSRGNSFYYYSRQGGPDPPANHAKSERV